MSDASELLRVARARAGLTQAEVARRSGLTQPAVARIERGRSDPRVSTLAAALDACGQDLSGQPRPALDESLLRRNLRLSPAQRIVEAEQLAEEIAPLVGLAAR